MSVGDRMSVRGRVLRVYVGAVWGVEGVRGMCMG